MLTILSIVVVVLFCLMFVGMAVAGLVDVNELNKQTRNVPYLFKPTTKQKRGRNANFNFAINQK